MEQHILKHNEHYLGEIGTRNNCFTQYLVASFGVVKEVSMQFYHCNNKDRGQIIFL